MGKIKLILNENDLEVHKMRIIQKWLIPFVLAMAPVFNAHALVIVTLTDGGLGLTSMHISGSGITGDSFNGSNRNYGPFFGPLINASGIPYPGEGEGFLTYVPSPFDIYADTSDTNFIGGSTLLGFSMFEEGHSDEFHFHLAQDSTIEAGVEIDLNLSYAIDVDFSRFVAGSHIPNPDSFATKFFSGFQLVVVESVPEPSIIALFAAGLFGLSFVRRRQA